MSKYPSEATVCDWYNEWEDHLAQLQLAGEPEECLEYFIARKACDWQREQDAQTCDYLSYTAEASSTFHNADKRAGCSECADAIRSHHPKETP